MKLGFLALFIVVSIILLSPNPFAQGVQVDFVSQNSPAKNILKSGDIILKFNGADATPELFDKSYMSDVRLETTQGTRIVHGNGTLGISVITTPNTNLHFGLDIRGGVQSLIKPNTTDETVIDQTISTLETRINLFGLRESVFRKVKTDQVTYIEVSIAGGTSEELQDLLQTEGKFEGKIPFKLRLSGSDTAIQLDRSYAIKQTATGITFNNIPLTENQSTTIDEIPFLFTGVSDNAVHLVATVFESDDIRNVFYDPQRSSITVQQDGSTQWSFGVQISPDGATRFQKITGNLGFVPGGSLDAPIELYLDNELIDSLSISSSLKGQFQTEVSITGGAQSRDLAVKERSRLQSILRSGALPTSIEIVQVDRLSPNLGERFLQNAAMAGLGAVLGIFLVVLIRYRQPKLVMPVVFVSLSEVLIILGIATGIGWTIDLAAIGGIIASVGTGVDSQIIILDQTLRKTTNEEMTLRKKLQHAFFIIFGAAGTIIAAMLPLLVLGFGLLRGFALVTIIGVLVGALVTRPAFGVIVEKLVKEE
ncbi:MAG: hypothetical protein HY832_02205 [Candidatus Aenigmarchaeota archaeon]|nr:hypothetical protein [Candidatus Aenigmarchaeota archaeon]